jgi:hypothetical protein
MVFNQKSLRFMAFTSLDYIAFGLYGLILLSVGLWVSRGKKDVQNLASQ